MKDRVTWCRRYPALAADQIEKLEARIEAAKRCKEYEMRDESDLDEHGAGTFKIFYVALDVLKALDYGN